MGQHGHSAEHSVATQTHISVYFSSNLSYTSSLVGSDQTLVVFPWITLVEHPTNPAVWESSDPVLQPTQSVSRQR